MAFSSYALDKGHNKNVDSYKKAHNQDQDNYGKDGLVIDDEGEEVSNEKCDVFHKCRACSFKEMQEIQECQITGYRLVKRCI